MGKYIFIFLVAVALALASCNSAGTPKDGGSSDASIVETEPVILDDGTQGTKVTETKVNVKQPQNPTGQSGLTVSKGKDGSRKITASPGGR